MKLFNSSKNKQIKDLKNLNKQLQDNFIKKNFVNLETFYGNYTNNNNYTLSIENAMKLYRECSPFFMVVEKIVNSYAEIPFKIYDTKNKEYLENHPALNLLNNPNYDCTEFEFKETLALNFLITGNTFLLCTGNIKKPPLEIFNMNPLFFQANSYGIDNINQIPKSWQYNNMKTIKFYAQETIEGLKFYNGNDKELYHIKKYNPCQYANDFFGMSKAYPLFQEMESYIAGNNNNSALLKNGARPSSAWVNNRGEELTNTQYERIQQESKKFQGSDNTGRPLILDGLDYKEMSQNNKDMQFKELQDSMLSRIANVYGVPLALILDSTMTLNNLQTARLHLDKDAVIPLAKRINEELTKLILARYPDSENLKFNIDISTIESLKPEVLSNALLMKQINVNTPNEIRADIGYAPIDGGDELPNDPSPLNMNDLINNTDQENNDNDANDEEKQYQEFYSYMKTEQNTDEEIKALWILSNSK